MSVKGCGATADGKVTIDLSTGSSYIIRPGAGAREELLRAKFPTGMLEDVMDALSRAAAGGSFDPDAFMRRCRLHEFRSELERLNMSSRLNYEKARSVLCLVTVAEPVMTQ